MGKIILSILVLGGLSFVIFSGSGKNSLEENEKSDNVSAETLAEENSDKTIAKSFNEKTTLEKLIEKGGDYQCEFSQKTEISDSTGVVYISDKNIRGDFSSSVSVEGLGDLGSIDTHMISDGESIYTWSSFSEEGTKSAIVKDGQKDTENVPLDKELDYRCVSWKSDESKFSIPTNITFKNI